MASQDTEDAADLIPSNSEDEVVCYECNETFGQITASHLSTHGMTMAEYRERYPEATVQPQSVRDAGGWSDETHGDDTREKISEAINDKHENGDY